MPDRNCSLSQYVLANTCISNIVREGIIFETALSCGISSLEDVPILYYGVIDVQLTLHENNMNILAKIIPLLCCSCPSRVH